MGSHMHNLYMFSFHIGRIALILVSSSQILGKVGSSSMSYRLVHVYDRIDLQVCSHLFQQLDCEHLVTLAILISHLHRPSTNTFELNQWKTE